MHALALRAGRRSLARTIALLAVAGSIGACATETTAPTLDAPARAAANTAAPSVEYTTTVDLVVRSVTHSPTYGTSVLLEITCSTAQVLDVIVELEQQVRSDRGKELIQGSNDWAGYSCRQGTNGVSFAMDATHPKLNFDLGRATVRARIANFQPGVEPAAVTTRTRILPDLL